MDDFQFGYFSTSYLLSLRQRKIDKRYVASMEKTGLRQFDRATSQPPLELRGLPPGVGMKGRCTSATGITQTTVSWLTWMRSFTIFHWGARRKNRLSRFPRYAAARHETGVQRGAHRIYLGDLGSAIRPPYGSKIRTDSLFDWFLPDISARRRQSSRRRGTH